MKRISQSRPIRNRKRRILPGRGWRQWWTIYSAFDYWQGLPAAAGAGVVVWCCCYSWTKSTTTDRQCLSCKSPAGKPWRNQDKCRSLSAANPVEEADEFRSRWWPTIAERTTVNRSGWWAWAASSVTDIWLRRKTRRWVGRATGRPAPSCRRPRWTSMATSWAARRRLVCLSTDLQQPATVAESNWMAKSVNWWTTTFPRCCFFF